MILVFGATGQVGKELKRFENVFALAREKANLSYPQACADMIKLYLPRAVINAAAFTGVDQAEVEESTATVINSDAPKTMAQTCAMLDIPFVHISSDYVFDGSGLKPWQPSDQTKPMNAYGRSKHGGEKGVLESGAISVILRTSWVVSAHGSNFIKTMLSLSDTHNELKVVSDQIGGPTPASNIAAVCLQIAEQLILDPSKAGIYHLSGAPYVSWADFAREIFYQARRTINVTEVLTSDYPTPTRRPLNSRLDCLTTEQVFGVRCPDWRAELKSILRDLGEST